MPFMALYDIQWWEEVLTDGHEAEFDFADIKVTKDYLSNGYRVLLYEFPNADKAPLAKYGAIVIDENGYATYFTTEKTKIRSFGIFVCQKLTHTRIAVRDANAEALMSSRNRLRHTTMALMSGIMATRTPARGKRTSERVLYTRYLLSLSGYALPLHYDTT